MRASKTIPVVVVAVLVVAACNKPMPTEEPVTEANAMQLNGLIGGEAGGNAGNSVFVDLSTGLQTPVARASWDLRFFAGADFKVLINHTTAATARVVAKNDLTRITTADTAGFAAHMKLDSTARNFAVIDDVMGGIATTVIATVAANDADNNVYVIDRGIGGGIPARDWYKIRVLRKGEGYTLQYARLSETTFRTLDIAKNANYNFQYVSFDNGPVSVEPPKAQWDFEWTYRMFQARRDSADPSSLIPYPVSDFIELNAKAGVGGFQMYEGTMFYRDYHAVYLENSVFPQTMELIGTSWRSLSEPPSTARSFIIPQRYYVLRDASWNVYKIRFLHFHPDEGGTRGKPEFEYKLVKKG